MKKCKKCSKSIQEGDLCPRCKLEDQRKRAEKIDKALDALKTIGPLLLAAGSIILGKILGNHGNSRKG